MEKSVKNLGSPIQQGEGIQERGGEMTKLRLSEAMRLGAMLKPQGFGIFRNRGITACAMDAVALALGGTWGEILVMFPWADGDSAQCPTCGLTSDTVLMLATHLNDVHRWTRERIADWIEAEFEKPKAVAVEEEAAVL